MLYFIRVKIFFPCDKQTAGKFDADLVFLDSEKLYNVLPSSPTTLSLFHVRILLFSLLAFSLCTLNIHCCSGGLRNCVVALALVKRTRYILFGWLVVVEGKKMNVYCIQREDQLHRYRSREYST